MTLSVVDQINKIVVSFHVDPSTWWSTGIFDMGNKLASCLFEKVITDYEIVYRDKREKEVRLGSSSFFVPFSHAFSEDLHYELEVIDPDPDNRSSLPPPANNRVPTLTYEEGLANSVPTRNEDDEEPPPPYSSVSVQSPNSV